MTSRLTLRFAMPALLAAAIMLAAAGLIAESQAAGPPPVALEGVWARPAPASGNSAVYLHLTNTGDAGLRLAGYTGDVAGVLEIHETVLETTTGSDGRVSQIMKMQPIAALEIEPGESVQFKPGGLHLMLMRLNRDLAEGDTFRLELQFEGYDPLPVEVPVRAAHAPGAGHHAEHAGEHHAGHGGMAD